MKKKGTPVQTGDTFMKNGDGNKNIWVVARLWTHIDGLLYASLQKESNANDVITVSVLALTNRSYFVPVQHAVAA